MAEKGVSHVRWSTEGGVLLAAAVVKSSSVLNQSAYCCTMYPPHRICCDCMDFRSRGGLCKHLRAAFLEVCHVQRIAGVDMFDFYADAHQSHAYR